MENSIRTLPKNNRLPHRKTPPPSLLPRIFEELNSFT